MPEKMLHRSWIHAGADAPRREGVSEKMRMAVLHTGWSCSVYRSPHGPERRLRQHLPILHMDHIRRRPLLFEQELLQRRGNGYISAGGRRFQHSGNRRVITVTREGEVVSDMDKIAVQVDILPHKAEYLPSPHTGGQRDEDKCIRPLSFKVLQKFLRLLRGKRFHFFCRPPSCFIRRGYGRLGNQAVVSRRSKHPLHDLKALGLQRLTGIPQRGQEHLNVHRLDVPQPHVTEERKDVVAEVGGHDLMAAFSDFRRRLVDAEPEVCVLRERRHIRYIHACVPLDLCLQYFLFQFLLTAGGQVHALAVDGCDMGSKSFLLRHENSSL